MDRDRGKRDMERWTIVPILFKIVSSRERKDERGRREGGKEEIGRFNILIRERFYRSRRSYEQDELLPICIRESDKADSAAN